jgi:hypothetical protein
MKKVLGFVLLVSALNIQAMDQKQSPQQQKKRETSEELLRKAVERLAEEQKEKESTTEQQDELIVAFKNLWSVLTKKGTESFTSVKKQIDSHVTAMLNEEGEPCTLSDNKVTKGLGTYWQEFSVWMDKKEKNESASHETVALPSAVAPTQEATIVQDKPLLSDEQMSELFTGLKEEHVEFFKSMIKVPGFTAEQLEGVKNLIDELRKNQIQ